MKRNSLKPVSEKYSEKIFENESEEDKKWVK